MQNAPKLPPLHDLVRAYALTLEETIQRLLDFYQRPPTTWGYGPVRRAARAAFAHDVPLSAISHAMLATGSPAGRKQNAEVANHIWLAGDGRSIRTQPLTTRSIALRRDVSIRVPVDFRFTEDKKPNLFWVQPRRGFAFTQRGLGVLGAIFRMTYLVDDLEGAGVEILDLSATPRGPRAHVVYTLEDLPLITEDEVTSILQRVVAAYDAICEMDFDWDADSRARRARKLPPPPSPGLFG